MIAVSERKDLVKSALDHQPFDLVIHNERLVNVYTGVVEPAAVGIKHGRVVCMVDRPSPW
jgi:adenine deaminase